MIYFLTFETFFVANNGAGYGYQDTSQMLEEENQQQEDELKGKVKALKSVCGIVVRAVSKFTFIHTILHTNKEIGFVVCIS